MRENPIKISHKYLFNIDNIQAKLVIYKQRRQPKHIMQRQKGKVRYIRKGKKKDLFENNILYVSDNKL